MFSFVKLVEVDSFVHIVSSLQASRGLAIGIPLLLRRFLCGQGFNGSAPLRQFVSFPSLGGHRMPSIVCWPDKVIFEPGSLQCGSPSPGYLQG